MDYHLLEELEFYKEWTEWYDEQIKIDWYFSSMYLDTREYCYELLGCCEDKETVLMDYIIDGGRSHGN